MLSFALALPILQGVTGTAGIEPLAPSLRAHYETDPGGLKLTMNMRHGVGPVFGVLATFEGSTPSFTTSILVGGAVLDAGGEGSFSVVFPSNLLPQIQQPLALTGVYLENGALQYTDDAAFRIAGGLPCETLDFNHTLGDDSIMAPGRVLSDEWADMGMFVSAENARPMGPDAAVLFDTANPTGEDDDLLTPNPMAIGNTTALGNVLVIAEDDVDLDEDDLIDDPDDERFGGSMFFDFEDGATICSVTLLDIDEQGGAELRFYRDGDLMTPDVAIPVASLGDGSVQRIDLFESEVERLEVFMAGSGAVAGMDLMPCPSVVNFDETSTGIPRFMQAGEWITNQFSASGLTISAFNNSPGHPDKAILFDSENPTGEDDDLLTPNPNVPGNDTPLGLVLILAEDDIDVNPADGLVDDPDDEANGGVITFSFDMDVTFLSAMVLDVDGTQLDEWRFYDAQGDEITSIVIPDLPDGNVQTIDANVSGVRRAELELGGSGAVTRIRFCPDGANPQEQ